MMRKSTGGKAAMRPATVRKATRKATAEEVIDIGYEIWEAYTLDGRVVGYLVTEEGNVDRPVAMVCCDKDHSDDSQVENAIIHAEWIADDHALAGRSYDQAVIDLCHYGRANSVEMMPGFVYGLKCWPLNDDRTIADVKPVEPAPFCKFRLAAMQAKASSVA
jgi:hypothetical protein